MITFVDQMIKKRGRLKQRTNYFCRQLQCFFLMQLILPLSNMYVIPWTVAKLINAKPRDIDKI